MLFFASQFGLSVLCHLATHTCRFFQDHKLYSPYRRFRDPDPSGQNCSRKSYRRCGYKPILAAAACAAARLEESISDALYPGFQWDDKE